MGGFQGRGVIDAVAKIAHDVAARLKGLDQARLLVGRQPPIGVDRLHLDRQGVIAQLGDVSPRQHRVCVEPDEPRQAPDDDGIVSGEDLKPDARSGEAGDGCWRRGLGRVGKGA